VFGIFSASLVFGFVGRTRTRVEPLLTEGFESPALPLERGLPTRVGVWSGNARPWRKADGEVKPAEGQHVVTLPLVEKSRFSYVFRLVDVSALPGLREDLCRQLEVTARFRGTVTGAPNRFQIRLAAFAEDAAGASEIWIKNLLDEMALDHVAKTEQAHDEWTTVRTAIDVPPNAQVVLVSLGAANAVDSPKSHHFLDDVQIRLITREDDPLPLAYLRWSLITASSLLPTPATATSWPSMSTPISPQTAPTNPMHQPNP
jgi:hypothetical protein